MRQAFVVSTLVVAIFGCASILDIPQLEAPAPGGADGGGEGGTGSACTGTGPANIVGTPRSIHTAVDATDIYFTKVDPTRDSAILRCAKCGCDKPIELVTRLNQPGGIAVDDAYVFWTDTDTANGSINRIEKNDPSKRQSLAGQESPVGIAVDEEFVYWTVIGGGPVPLAKSGVYRARKTDFSGVTKLVASAGYPGDILPYALAVDATHVYYTLASDLVEKSADPCVPDDKVSGTIRRIDKRGGALQKSQVLAMGQPCPVAIAIDQDTVYWTNLGEGSALSGDLRLVPKAGGTERIMAQGLGRPTSLAFHGGRLTWNLPANMRVESCTPPECADRESLARDQVNPSGVSADSSGIYWAVFGDIARSYSDGAIRRAPTPAK